ncbi:MAG TPA: histidine kinase [Galbitalea sp.]
MTDVSLVGRGRLGRGLSLFGAAALSWSVVVQFSHGRLPVWILVGALAANIAWILLIPLSVRGRVSPWVCVGVMVVAGGITAGALDGTSLVPAGVAVLWLTRDIRHPIWWGVALGLATGVLVLVGDVVVPITLLGLIALEAGLIVAFLAGLSRRQFMVADYRSRELIEEQARSDVLSARQQIAHDIHDVLAHSLGGLVIQLDAVDALLESGDTSSATAKVHDARALAAEGLTEARRAVAALTEPAAQLRSKVPGERVLEDVSALVDAHRSLGGRVELRERGVPHEVSESVEVALRRAVQEGLTNARKHAPGARVTVILTWTDGFVEAVISNPLRAGVRAAGGGHGLVGMRERFAALPGGTVTSGTEAGNFVVTAKAKTA